MSEEVITGMIFGFLVCFLGGIFIATDDDITGDQIKVAAEVCGGWENISYFDADGEDTFVCENGEEYSYATGASSFNSAYEWLKKNKKE